MDKVKKNSKFNKLPVILLIIFIIAFLLSPIKAKNYSIWFFEAFPAFVGVMILVFTYKKFRFTDFIYVLILILTIIILIGAHYKYDGMPLFNWIKNTYGLKRNNYDRLGHFMQGFVPAFIIREVMIRKLKFKKGPMLSILIVCICLALSSFYEIIEAASSLLYGKSPEEFLAFQGDELDTQWDMFMALTGSIISVSIFSKIHDRHMHNLENH